MWSLVGRVLNIETVFMPILPNRWSVDTETVQWPAEHRGVLSILRAHFDQRVRGQEAVEVLDFLPKFETWNCPLAVPNPESFTKYDSMQRCDDRQLRLLSPMQYSETSISLS